MDFLWCEYSTNEKVSKIYKWSCRKVEVFKTNLRLVDSTTKHEAILRFYCFSRKESLRTVSHVILLHLVYFIEELFGMFEINSAATFRLYTKACRIYLHCTTRGGQPMRIVSNLLEVPWQARMLMKLVKRYKFNFWRNG